jgi:hypothetical protein
VIQITTAQWYAWISAFIFPFLRILGLVLAEPVSGNRSVPIAAKVGLATFVTLVLAPVLPPIPPVDPASAAGVLIAVQQLAIGLAMGFAVRIALTAAEMAGQLAGLQMGLGFAVFFDPHSSAQTVVVGRFVGLFAILVFLATNGHALVLGVLVESFRALPAAGGVGRGDLHRRPDHLAAGSRRSADREPGRGGHDAHGSAAESLHGWLSGDADHRIGGVVPGCAVHRPGAGRPVRAGDARRRPGGGRPGRAVTGDPSRLRQRTRDVA